MISLEQIRAHRAFQLAHYIGIKKEFLSFARNLPALFQNNGLLATWAFMLAKAKPEPFNAHQEILNMMLEHYRAPQIELLPTDGKSAEEVFRESWTQSSINGKQLMALTAEAIAFSGWIKRAAEALCDAEGGQG